LTVYDIRGLHISITPQVGPHVRQHQDLFRIMCGVEIRLRIGDRTGILCLTGGGQDKQSTDNPKHLQYATELHGSPFHGHREDDGPTAGIAQILDAL